MTNRVSKERLRELIDWHLSFPLNANGQDTLAALRELESLREGWIACSERTPDIGVRVILLCGKNSFVDIGRFDGVEDTGFNRGPRWRDDRGALMVPQWHPTHWMPLPPRAMLAANEKP